MYAALAFLGLCGIPASALGAATPAPALSTPALSTPALSAPMSAQQVVQMLDQTMDWYRSLAVQQLAATEPSDLLVLYENRQTADQVVRLAFEVARADADLLAKEPAAGQKGEDATASSPALIPLQAKLDAQGLSVQRDLDAERHQLTMAAKKDRPQLQARIAELQGELDLINTKRSIVGSLSGFENVGGATGSVASALHAQIDAMAVAVPSANGAAVPAAGAASSTTARAGSTASSPLPAAISAVSAAAPRFGLWALAENVFKLWEKIRMVEAIDEHTAALQTTLTQIRERLLVPIRALSAQGDALVTQAGTADSATLNAMHEQFDALASQFKQASAIFLPLSKESILLAQYRRSLETWRAIVESQTRDALKTLGIRVGAVLVILSVVFALAELWRHAVTRYVPDKRRRHQLMLLRRIALWSLIAVIVGFGFVNELGAIITFAGLITAGLAVAMQSVLVSIVGYFFLIGKYGIRIGDRVQIGEVNGEVIHLGLVRVYLMEYGGHGSLGPTGRVVAFPNSVIFQVSSGLFKQIPGVSFAWHEITLSLPAGADYASIKEKLYAAATDALKDYYPEIQRQSQEIQRTTLSDTGIGALPTIQLRFSPNGVEAHVRYPVHLRHAAEIDERVSQALAQVISNLTRTTEAGASA